MAEEIELKLELTPEAADCLEASPLLQGAATKVDQRAIYFDTPDRTLFANGLSLRIRRSGRKRVQTVKADDPKAAGLFARPEWEMPVKSDTPVLDDRTPVRALLGEDCETVAPAFAVHVQRRTWMIADGDAEIELVVDRGAVILGERQAPICEVELELKAGAPTALFALARRIDAIAPVRIGVLTKSERGYRLLGPAPALFKAEQVVLEPGQPAHQAFRRIARNCLRHYRLNEAILLERPVPEALHQARVALRRLRSAFGIFKPMLADARTAHFRDELRWLSSTLGDARNLDVLVGKAVPGPLHDRLEAARDAAYADVETALASARARSLMIDLVEWLADGDWLRALNAADARYMPAAPFAAAALRRLRRKVRTGGRYIAAIDEEERHEVRKDAKKLRYASEFFATLFAEKRQRRRFKAFVGALGELQDILGALNDRATAPAVLAQLGLADEKGARALLDGRKTSKLLAAAPDAQAELVDAKRFWV